MTTPTPSIATFLADLPVRAIPAAIYFGLIASLYWAFEPALPWWRFCLGVAAGVSLFHYTVASAIAARR